MLMRAEDKITLLINGTAHDDWMRYEVDSDLFIPADAWSLELGLAGGQVPPKLSEGTAIRLMLGGDVVLSGVLDCVAERIDRQQHSFSLRGRDGAGILVDCSAPIFTTKQATLAEVVKTIVNELGVRNVRIAAESSFRADKVNIEPGDTAWDALQHAAEAAGLWPWFEPDGTLVVGGPDYSAPVVGTLILGGGDLSADQQPLESLSVTRDLARRVSQITVLGQTHGGNDEGKNALKATVKDPAVNGYRPKIVIDHEADTPGIAQTRARKLLADSRLAAFTAEAAVTGHRAPNGKPWAPGMRVHVVSARHQLDQILFCTARKISGGRGQPSVTHLTLKEDALWIPDAHPHKRKHRRGKNDSNGQILNIPGYQQ
ncbi:phage baseplate assembly protein [uncultured Deefgea sp.]|uniref:phage baseplate assembly protein n=1 Tax=uncultured Deefgea sp. TaxID=1304914 RepID=UPI0025991FF0|nr:phage tail protein [uncultured Deefgea sp.]